MQLSINGKQLDLGAAFREYIDGQLPLVFDKYFENPTEGNETMSKQGHEVRADVTVHVGKGLLHGHAEARDAYTVFDKAVEHVGKRLRRFKRRLHNFPKERLETADVLPALQYVFEAVNDAVENSNEPGQPSSLRVGYGNRKINTGGMVVSISRISQPRCSDVSMAD